MSETAVRPVNGHVNPAVSLLKFAPELLTTPEPPAVAPAVVGGEPRPAAGSARERSLKRAARQVRTVAAHDRTRTALRTAVRHTAYVWGGAGVVTKQAWEGRTVAVHHRMRAMALAAGDTAAAADWQQKADTFRRERHQRRMDLITGTPRAVKSAAIGAAGVEGALLLTGVCMALSSHEVRDVAAPTMAAIDAVNALAWFVGVAWGPALALAMVAALAHLWKAGQGAQTAPAWARPASAAADDVPITPSIVVKALTDLGISELRKGIKAMADGAAGMLGPITLAGCGVEVDVTLPSGVSTDEVLNRRRKLAENLNRHEHELHMTLPPAPRTVRMWIADSGALDVPIGPSPLVTDADTTADMHKSRAPWGVDLRGDTVLISLWQRHMLITGLSNQGKTASLRALALWLALDPRVELRIADLKGTGDWSMFEGLATKLVSGPTDEHVMEATHMVEEGVAEMERRISLMGALTAKGWSQDKVMADPRFRPLLLIVDEAQVAYGSGAVETSVSDSGAIRKGAPYGGSKADSRYFQAVKRTHDQGRAVGVTIWEGTQDPTNENLPKRSREGNHIRAALVLGTESQARMAVGDSAVDAGAAPHKLRQGLDKGVLVVAGDGVKLAPGQPSITVRTHFIGQEDAQELAERAKKLRAGVQDGPADEPVVAVADPLADVAAVLGQEKRMLTSDVLARLKRRNSAEYGAWTPQKLNALLDEAGHGRYKSDGRMYVSLQRVMDALSERDEGGTDESE
jgi:DNA segregation ATPase FtsK/SpoIIIE, S-DNA-T family